MSSSVGTKFVRRWSDLRCRLVFKAVRMVRWDADNGKNKVDIKRYARVEKVPGGEVEDDRVLDGVMLDKSFLENTAATVGIGSAWWPRSTGAAPGLILLKHRELMTRSRPTP